MYNIHTNNNNKIIIIMCKCIIIKIKKTGNRFLCKEYISCMKPKIIISGTGRCGTTFLMALFSCLGFDTGFTKQNYKSNIDKESKGGMETKLKTPHSVVKNPAFIEEEYLNYIINNNMQIKYFIIPIRRFSDAAESRSNLSTGMGGLWKATDAVSQEAFYDKLISKFLFYAVKYDFNVIFIDFHRMITNKLYLYNKLAPVLKEKAITYERFSEEYGSCSREMKR